MNSKVSFTIRPPTSSSRTPEHARPSSRSPTSQVGSFTSRPDSSDEDDEDAIEAITAFDESGAQRLQEKLKPSGPLVIPALANRDWRAVARLRKKQSFIPDGTAVQVGVDGSQGGLGTRDTINSGPQVAGLVIRTKRESITTVDDGSVNDITQEVSTSTLETQEESEDERARRALLASAEGGIDEGSIAIDPIPISGNNNSPPVNESDAFRRDVVTRPNSATLADYERVPVSQFGAALLRGMGWKEGTAASRTRRGLVEPWLPTSRPALLGIGAKERPAEDIPLTGKGRFVTQRSEKRYIPVVKVQRESSGVQTPSRSRSRSPGRSRPVSRAPSPKSTSLYTGDQDKDRSHRRGGREGVYDDSSYSKSGRDPSHGTRAVESDREIDYGRQREHAVPERDRDRRDRGRNERRTEKGYTRDEIERYSRDRGDKY